MARVTAGCVAVCHVGMALLKKRAACAGPSSNCQGFVFEDGVHAAPEALIFYPSDCVIPEVLTSLAPCGVSAMVPAWRDGTHGAGHGEGAAGNAMRPHLERATVHMGQDARWLHPASPTPVVRPWRCTAFTRPRWLQCGSAPPLRSPGRRARTAALAPRRRPGRRWCAPSSWLPSRPAAGPG